MAAASSSDRPKFSWEEESWEYDVEDYAGWSDERWDDARFDADGERQEFLGRPPNPVEAAEGFVDLLISEFMEGRMTAKLMCVISWWASHAGVKGIVEELAMRPQAPTGHFHRHVELVLHLSEVDERRCTIAVPGHDKHSSSRTLHAIPAIPPHEAIHTEVVNDPEILDVAAENSENFEIYSNMKAGQQAEPEVWRHIYNVRVSNYCIIVHHH